MTTPHILTDEDKVNTMTGANLPVIIDAPGEYITKAGDRVEMFAITEGKSTFPCQGTIYRKTKNGKGYTTEFQTWKPNGQNKALGTTKNDIARKA